MSTDDKGHYTSETRGVRFYRPPAHMDDAEPRWQLVETQPHYSQMRVTVVEDHLPLRRALAIGALLGVNRDRMLEAMREAAQQLRVAAAARLESARLERQRQEMRAVTERRVANDLQRQLTGVCSSLEVDW